MLCLGSGRRRWGLWCVIYDSLLLTLTTIGDEGCGVPLMMAGVVVESVHILDRMPCVE